MSKKSLIITSLAAVIVLALGGSYLLFTKTFATQKKSVENVAADTAEKTGAVATVNGEELSREDFNAQLEQAQQTYIQQGLDPASAQIADQLKTQVLDQMIAGTLFKQEAKKTGLIIDDAEVEAEISRLIESVGGREVFDQELAKASVAEDTVKINIGERMLIDKYLEAQISAGEISATDEEVRALYDEMSAQQPLPPFEDVQEDAKKAVIQKKQNELISALVTSLRADANIEILL
ncbi:MAG: SurA N-terminal domain-containing protein [bacterium]|nr:SurA N-terminal domain-containing protein [bacterium]